MADLSNMGFDPNVPEATGGFTTLIPEGQHRAVIVKSAVIDTKNGNGKILKLKWQIIEGDNKGETVDDWINIINQSKVAQDIGQGTVKRICGLCNTPYPPTNTETQWHGKPMVITIKHEKFKSNTTGNELTSMKVSAYNPGEQIQNQQNNSGGGGSW